jgi:hypothetical protein
MSEVKKTNNGTIDASRALAAKLNVVKAFAAKAKPSAVKTAKAEKDKQAKAEPFTAKIPLEARSRYQKRLYLHPSYNAPEWANKEPELIALKTLYIDERGRFQLWTCKVAESLISDWIKAEKLKSFTTTDIEKKFKLFGGGVSDISRSACKKLEAQALLEHSKVKHGKKERYLYKVK